MREALWKPHVPYLLVFGILLAVMAVGCAQSPGEGGGDQTSEDRTTVTQADTTAQEETTVGEETTTSVQESTSQRAHGGGQIEITMQGEGQRRQGAREEAPASQQGEQQTITVRITGTEGLSFAGRIGSTQALRRVQGNVPEEYEIPFEGTVVTAAIRKQEPGRGTLGVEVVRDGEVVASQETSATTGLVNVVWSPQQEQGN